MSFLVFLAAFFNMVSKLAASVLDTKEKICILIFTTSDIC